MIDHCAKCGVGLGTFTQETLPGVGVEKYCIACETKRRGDWLLAYLPEENELEYASFTDWEQSFLASIRKQIANGRAVSEKQYEILERLYAKGR